jgi:hypothetical protein
MYSTTVRRPLWVRFFIACWSLWLVAALSEPAALSACPAHSSHGAHSAEHSAAMHDEAMQSHHGAHRSDPADQHSDNHCSCLGECCCTPSIAPPAATIAELPPTVVTHATPVAACATAPTSLAPYSLPFANGPPGSLVA